MSFWGELKRRNVFKVGAAYVIAAWLIVQVANTFFPILHLPQWTVTFIAALLILGLPIALILAWAYEMTPEGVKLTKKVPLTESITHVTGRKLNYILAGVIVLALVYILFDNLYLDRRVVETEAVKTIAVLPFENLSSDPEQEYFVDGLSEEILNSLAKIPDLRVIAKTSSFAFKGKDKTIQEIADVLGADHILEGSVRKVGNDLRITAQLIQAADGVHLWSETYDRELKDIFAVQEDIASAVADELKVTLGVGESLRQLGVTDNLEAYELYLVARGQFDAAYRQTFIISGWRRTLESVEAALALDPEFAMAWALKAETHLQISTFGPVDRSTTEQDEALRASLKSIEIEPNLVDGYLVLYSIKFSRCDFLEAGYTYRKALALKTEPSPALKFVVAFRYYSMGNFERTNELTEEMLRNDPLNQSVRLYYFSSFGFHGNMQRAEEEYQNAKALSEGEFAIADQVITVLRVGQGHALSRDDFVLSHPIFDAAKEHLGSPEEGLAVLHQFYSDDSNLNSPEYFYVSCLAAYFGDPEFAMDALKKAVNIDAKGIFVIWLPVMHEIRQLPRFKEFVQEIGLVDYWNEFGWPGICRPLDNGDFVCD